MVSLVSLGANSSIRCVSTYIDVVGVDVVGGGVVFDGLKNNPRVVIYRNTQGGGDSERGDRTANQWFPFSFFFPHKALLYWFYLLTCYYVPVAVLGAVLLLLGDVPRGRLALEEALYHQQHTRTWEGKLHVMDP